MIAQKPAEGILAGTQWQKSKTFVVPCTCHCGSKVTLSIDVDDFGITTHIFSNTKTAYWREQLKITYKESWLVLSLKYAYNDWYNRLGICWTALTKGYVETEEYVMLSKQQTLNLSQALLDSIATLENFEKEAEEEVIDVTYHKQTLGD